MSGEQPNKTGEAITIGGVKYRLFEDEIGPALQIIQSYNPDKPVELLHFRSMGFAVTAFDGAVSRARAKLKAELEINQNQIRIEQNQNKGENHD
ncbi:hypothetical protein LCGC14_0542480 [marine sediment metagenome]|uniref:Uncharacterized protein n=1 Tax=marine sediment metagenome TaxID=412755 RepID=A0A0F9V0M6_9ZZZZ